MGRLHKGSKGVFIPPISTVAGFESLSCHITNLKDTERDEECEED